MRELLWRGPAWPRQLLPYWMSVPPESGPDTTPLLVGAVVGISLALLWHRRNHRRWVNEQVVRLQQESGSVLAGRAYHQLHPRDMPPALWRAVEDAVSQTRAGRYSS